MPKTTEAATFIPEEIENLFRKQLETRGMPRENGMSRFPKKLFNSVVKIHTHLLNIKTQQLANKPWCQTAINFVLTPYM